MMHVLTQCVDLKNILTNCNVEDLLHMNWGEMSAKGQILGFSRDIFIILSYLHTINLSEPVLLQHAYQSSLSANFF